MADDNPDNVLSATFPAPPPFWKHFTPDNRTRFTELQQQYAADHPAENASASDALPPRIPDVPPELRYLQPPEPPANGKYRNFGDAYDINTALTSLRSMGVEQLYPSPPSSPSPEQQADSSSNRQQVIHSQWTLDRAAYIKRMTQSLMLNYLEMLGVLSVDPARWQEKYEHMQTLLFNAHHLINEYRPHQARASLITMLEEQLAKRREEVEGVRRMREKIEGVLAGLASQSVDGVGDAAADAREKGAVSGVEAEEERRKREQRAVMKALDDELMAE